MLSFKMIMKGDLSRALFPLSGPVAIIAVLRSFHFLGNRLRIIFSEFRNSSLNNIWGLIKWWLCMNQVLQLRWEQLSRLFKMPTSREEIHESKRKTRTFFLIIGCVTNKYWVVVLFKRKQKPLRRREVFHAYPLAFCLWEKGISFSFSIFPFHQ